MKENGGFEQPRGLIIQFSFKQPFAEADRLNRSNNRTVAFIKWLPPMLPDVQFAHLSVVGSRWELTPDERVRTGGTCGRSAATSTYTKCARCVFIRVNICFFPPTKPGEKHGRLIGKAKRTKRAWIWLDPQYSTWNNAVTERQEVRSKVKGSQVQTNGKHLDCLLMQILLTNYWKPASSH